jgi:hypothetical protein
MRPNDRPAFSDSIVTTIYCYPKNLCPGLMALMRSRLLLLFDMPVDDALVEEYQDGNGGERVAQLLIGARFTASGNW